MITAKINAFAYHEITVLEGIDAVFEKGATHGIVGLNGAGKTTFFNLLSGYLKSPGSAFLMDGKPILRKQVAYMDTDLFFYPKLTGREFLSVFPKHSEFYQEDKMAELFRLPLDMFVEEYSTGMKKKLLLLSQVKQNKEIYILDEPFNGLDLETNKVLEIIISILNQRGKTVFISSHILDPLLTICSKIHHLKERRIYRCYNRSEFHQVEEDLFGHFKHDLNEELKNMI